ncbi:hypothetical protein RSAG8_07222, partial [Rhizoctonia solani AG-8 WAC10335]
MAVNQHLGDRWMAEQRDDFGLKKSGAMEIPAIRKHWTTMYELHGSAEELHTGLIQAAKILGPKVQGAASEGAFASIWGQTDALKVIPEDVFILMKPYRWMTGWVLSSRNNAQTALCAIGWCLFTDYLRKIVSPSFISNFTTCYLALPRLCSGMNL